MRSRNMQVLTDQLRAQFPGIVVYGIGDRAHQSSASGHNEDDTPGSRPEQEDPDNKPEHRAIDAMLGASFTFLRAWVVVTALVTVPANRARLLYVIFDGWIWRAKAGWVREVYGGTNPHRDHPHISGTWPDDENTAAWVLDPAPPPVDEGDEDMARMVFAVGRGWAAVDAGTWRDVDDNDTVLTADEQKTANVFAGVFGNSKELPAADWDRMRAHYAATGSVIEPPAVPA